MNLSLTSSEQVMSLNTPIVNVPASLVEKTASTKVLLIMIVETAVPTIIVLMAYYWKSCVLNKPWTIDVQMMNKSWTGDGQGLNKSLTPHEEVLNKSWTSQDC